MNLYQPFSTFICKCKQNSFSRHCNARLSAVKVWDIIENRACAAVVQGFSKPRTFECIYTNTFTSKVSRGLDKPIPKPSARISRGLSWPWVKYAVNIDLVPFTRAVRSLFSLIYTALWDPTLHTPSKIINETIQEIKTRIWGGKKFMCEQDSVLFFTLICLWNTPRNVLLNIPIQMNFLWRRHVDTSWKTAEKSFSLLQKLIKIKMILILTQARTVRRVDWSQKVYKSLFSLPPFRCCVTQSVLYLKTKNPFELRICWNLSVWGL